MNSVFVLVNTKKHADAVQTRTGEETLNGETGGGLSDAALYHHSERPG